MEYTNNPNQVVFLKDSDIVSSLDSFTVTTNGVASYDVAHNLCTEINGLDGRTTTEFQNTSSYINDTVSANLHEEISGLSTQTKTLSGNLKDEIDGIKADVKGGVNYKGHLKLDALAEPQYLSTYVAFLHGYQYSGGEVNVPDDVAATKLNNGWMYYISMNSALTSYTTKGDPGIKFVPGNYIIVHAHNSEGGTDAEASCVVLSDLKRENIDIIQVTDSDLVRFSNLSATSATLEAKYDPICATLSNAVTSLTSDVGYISTATDSKVSVVTYNNAGQQTDALSIDKLVINKMPAAQYVRLSNENNIDDNQLYFMTDEEMNAMGKRIVSVGNPTDPMDTANKYYVDSVSNSLCTSITEGIETGNVIANTVSAGALTVNNEAVKIDDNGLTAENGKVYAADLSAKTSLNVANGNIKADSTGLTAGAAVADAAGLSADTISAKTTLGVADKLTASSEGLTIDGILTATDNTAAGLVVDGILTANNTSVKAAGKLEAQTISANSGLTAATIDAETMSATTVKSPALSATSLTAGSVIANVDGLTATGKTIAADKLVATSSVEAVNLSGTTLSVGTNGSTKANDSGLTAKVVYASNEIKVSGTKVSINSSGIVGDAGTIIKAPDLSAGNTLKLGDYIIVDSNGAALIGNSMRVEAPTLTASTVVKAPLLSGTTLSVGSNTKANDNGLTANAIEASQIAASTVVATNTLTANSTGVNSDKDITIQSSAKLNTAKVQFNENTSIYKDNNYLNIKSNVNAISFTTNGLSANPDIIIENERLSTYLQSAADSVAENLALDLDSNTQKIVLKYKGVPKTTLDASNFIKDGFLESVEISTATIGGTPTVPCLVFTWNTDSGLTATPIALSAIAKPYSADGNILKLNNSTNEFSIDANALSTALTNAYVQKTGDNIASLTAGNQTIINGSGLTAQADGAIVKADNLSAKNLNLGSGTNNLTANDGGLTANTLSARTSLNVAGKVVADNTGMTIPGVLTATDSNANGLIVEGILSANDTSVKAAGKIEAQTISANNGLTAAAVETNELSATTVKTPSLSATSLTAGTITANINAGTVVATTSVKAPLLSGTALSLADNIGIDSDGNVYANYINCAGLATTAPINVGQCTIITSLYVADSITADAQGLTTDGNIEADILSATTAISAPVLSATALSIGSNNVVINSYGIFATGNNTKINTQTLSATNSIAINNGALTANSTGLTANTLKADSSFNVGTILAVDSQGLTAANSTTVQTYNLNVTNNFVVDQVLTANANEVELTGSIKVHGDIISGSSTNLTSIFAPIGHNHDDKYSLTTHNHDSAYAPLSVQNRLNAISALTIAANDIASLSVQDVNTATASANASIINSILSALSVITNTLIAQT